MTNMTSEELKTFIGAILEPVVLELRSQHQDAIKAMEKRHNEDKGLNNMKLIDNLEKFTGVGSEFYDWARKARNYIENKSPATKAMMLQAEVERNIPITTSNILSAKGEAGTKLDNDINCFLIHNTSGEAAAIIAQGNDCGCEAWRLLVKRYDPKTAESKRALMKSIMKTRTARNHIELEKNINEWELSIRRWEETTSKDVEDEQKVCTIIEMCPPKLQEHMMLTVKDEDNYEEVRKLIVRQIDLHRDQGPKPMDVDEVKASLNIVGAPEDHGGHDHTCSSQDAAWCDHMEQQHGCLAAITADMSCWRCGGRGHAARDCATPKGGGKGPDTKGKGKGWNDYKGKGKGWFDSKGADNKGKGKGWYDNNNPISYGGGKSYGKGGGKPINGSCYNCGLFGHMSRDCPNKGKGKGNVNSIEQNYEPYETVVGGIDMYVCMIDAEPWA